LTLPKPLLALRLHPQRQAAERVHGALCTSQQEGNAATLDLGLAHCRGKTSWKISAQEWAVEAWVKLNVPNML